MQTIENKALSWGAIRKSACILAEITIRKSQTTTDVAERLGRQTRVQSFVSHTDVIDRYSRTYGYIPRVSPMVTGNDGIGFFVLNSQRSFHIAEMYAGIIALAIVGYALNHLFVFIESRLLAWNIGLRRIEG